VVVDFNVPFGSAIQGGPMRSFFVLMIIASVLLSSGAQLLLKVGASAPLVQEALNGGSIMEIVTALAMTPQIFLGLVSFAISVGLWILVLAKIDVSLAYPFISLGIVVTVAAGHFLLGESVSPLRMTGVASIVLGMLIVAFGA
jgi:multidrug transporter EmrE-like cation transporter